MGMHLLASSSSVSDLHFGHYKVAAKNERLSEMHAVFINTAVNSGYHLNAYLATGEEILEQNVDPG
jgi:hypothetical protein